MPHLPSPALAQSTAALPDDHRSLLAGLPAVVTAAVLLKLTGARHFFPQSPVTAFHLVQEKAKSLQGLLAWAIRPLVRPPPVCSAPLLSTAHWRGDPEPAGMPLPLGFALAISFAWMPFSALRLLPQSFSQTQRGLPSFLV